jgi:PadR family transcriptional regulator, regulatory protein PadR
MAREGVSILKRAMDLLILKALSWGPMHGYGVSPWIRHVTEDTFDIQEGVLYPALHRFSARLRTRPGFRDNLLSCAR